MTKEYYNFMLQLKTVMIVFEEERKIFIQNKSECIKSKEEKETVYLYSSLILIVNPAGVKKTGGKVGVIKQ